MINSVLHHMNIWVHVQHLPGKHMAPESAMGRRKAGLGNVMLSAMFPWDPWVLPSIHFVMYQFTTQFCRPYTPFNGNWIDCDCGLFHMNSMSKAKVIQECLGNTDLNPVKYLWICCRSAIINCKVEAPPCNLHLLKYLLLTCTSHLQESRAIHVQFSLGLQFLI